VILEAKFLRDFLLGSPVHDNGTCRLILSVIELRRVREKLVKCLIIHDLASGKMSVGFWASTPCHFTADGESPADEFRKNSLKNRPKPNISSTPSLPITADPATKSPKL
jgi:hypothetical protein